MRSGITLFKLFAINLCFGLTNTKNNDTLIKKNGEHFRSVFPYFIGTLIHPQWCLTTAHATPNVGQSFTVDNEDFFVEKVIPHPLSSKEHHFEYKNPEIIDQFPCIIKYDIALVKLNKAITTRPFIERERIPSPSPSRNWIVSMKGEIPRAGLVQLCHVTQDVYYKSWTQKTVQPLLSSNTSLCFYNSQKNFDKGEYTFSLLQNQIIKLSHLNPRLEESELGVYIEDKDSGAAAFSFPDSYDTSLPPLNEIKLSGITIAALPSRNSETEGHLGVILRLSSPGINEFIDSVIFQDGLNNDSSDSSFTQPNRDFNCSNNKIAFGLPSILVNDSWIVTPKTLFQPIWLRRLFFVENDQTKKKELKYKYVKIENTIDTQNLRFIQFYYQCDFNLISNQYFHHFQNEKETWTVVYPATSLENLPSDFEYSSVKNDLWTLIQKEPSLFNFIK